MESNILSDSIKHKIDLVVLEELIEELYVPEFTSGFERPVTVSDYLSYVDTCNQKFVDLYSLMSSGVISDEINNKQKEKCVTSAIILYGEHFIQKPWTTDRSIEISKFTVEKLLNSLGYLNVCDALTSFNGVIFDNVIKKLRPKLLKNSWKNYPGAVVCYSWMLHLVESPHLAEHLNSILPTALILVDDFVSENRAIGLKCLEHIVNNVGRTHLCWYAQDEVILKALEPLVYFKEEELIESLISVLMALLKKKYPQVLNVELLVSEFDTIINTILHNMILEQRLKIRSAYTKMLPIIIRTRGLGMLLHSIALLKVIDEYVLEPSSSIESLEVLKCFMEVCWPRIHKHFDQIFLLICKVYLGIQQKRYSDICEKKLLELVSIMQKLCPEKMEERKNEISKHDFFPILQAIFS